MEERYKYKITPRCVIEEETEELSEKPLRDPLSRNDLLVNKLEYKNTKKNPFKPNLPKVLEPSKLQLPTNFSESYLH